MRRIVNGAIAEAELAEVVEVRWADSGRRARQLDGVVAKRPIHLSELGGPVIRLDLFYPFPIVNLSPEVESVGLNSVMAVVGA